MRVAANNILPAQPTFVDAHLNTQVGYTVMAEIKPRTRNDPLEVGKTAASIQFYFQFKKIYTY